MIEYATNYALVNKNTFKVDNIIWGVFYNLQQFEQSNLFLIEIGPLPVEINDTYNSETNKFYRNGQEVQFLMVNSDMEAALRIMGVDS